MSSISNLARELHFSAMSMTPEGQDSQLHEKNRSVLEPLVDQLRILQTTSLELEELFQVIAQWNQEHPEFQIFCTAESGTWRIRFSFYTCNEEKPRLIGHIDSSTTQSLEGSMVAELIDRYFPVEHR